MPSKELTKTCGICGDKAIGYYNFNAITCDSCKAFFRRNASKIDQFKCYFEGNCKISPTTRKVCKKCRLNKCFAIGMKKEWILTDEEKRWRNHKIEVNRKKRKIRVQSQSSHSSDDWPQSPTSSFGDKNTFQLLDEKQEIQIKCENEEIDVKPEIESRKYSVVPMSGTHCGPHCGPLSTYNNNRNKFTELEDIKLSELFNSLTLMKGWDNKSSQLIENPVIERACKAWAYNLQNNIQSIVSMSKHLTAFRYMCDNDQIALIKYGSVEINILRLILQFDFKCQFWVISDENNYVILKMDLLKRFRKSLFDAYDVFIQKVGADWDSDPIIIDLLTAIILYTPDRPDLIHRDDVRFQQNIYIYLLQRYLLLKYQSKCSEYESKMRFCRLMNVIKDLQNVSNQHRINYLKKDPDKVLPLLKEIFDIKGNEIQTDNYSLRAITFNQSMNKL